MKKAGFTLIELLVVIAIIAILVALAFPAYRGVMERSHAVQCGNNMKQIALGIQQYCSDNEDALFVTGTSGNSWAQTLNPNTVAGNRYVNTWRVFRSPFDKRADSESGTTSPVSYGINANIMAGNANKSNGAWATTDLTFPSQLILLAPSYDTTASTLAFTGVASDSGGGTTLVVPPASVAASRGTWGNRGKISVLYADYHVEPGLQWSNKATPTAAGPYFCDTASTSTTGGGLRRWVPDAQ